MKDTFSADMFMSNLQQKNKVVQVRICVCYIVTLKLKPRDRCSLPLLIHMYAWAQFRGTSDGKTVLEYWNYEVDPLTTMTREAFTKFIEGFCP